MSRLYLTRCNTYGAVHTHPLTDLEGGDAIPGDVIYFDGTNWIPANPGDVGVGVTSSTILVIDTHTALRLRTEASLGAAETVIVIADINGSCGIFRLDEGSVAADDGANVIHDADGRPWVRTQAPS